MGRQDHFVGQGQGLRIDLGAPEHEEFFAAMGALQNLGRTDNHALGDRVVQMPKLRHWGKGRV